MTLPYRGDPVLRAKRVARWQAMGDLYKSGLTLQEIANQFGCSREFIRQSIVKIGVTRCEGGSFRRSQDKQASFEAKRDAASLKHWGCNYDQYVEIRDLKKATRAFSNQRFTANQRGIGWELNLWQWWTIWQKSGRWPDRGRGQGYAMCRKGDRGSYAIGNVYIATQSQNMKDYWATKRSGEVACPPY